MDTMWELLTHVWPLLLFIVIGMRSSSKSAQKMRERAREHFGELSGGRQTSASDLHSMSVGRSDQKPRLNEAQDKLHGGLKDQHRSVMLLVLLLIGVIVIVKMFV